MEYDVIIVGGRVAGAILAARLSELGHRILVLEKANFPSNTLSTAFFRAPAMRVFEKIGVLEKVKAVAPPMTTLWNNIDGQILSDPVDAPEEHLRFFLCERRITLDWILYKRIKREPNVEIRLNANVKELIWQDGRVKGVRWNEKDGVREAGAKVVVGADGFYSTVVRMVEPVYENFIPVQRFIYYTYFYGLEPIEPLTAEHHFIENSLTYIFPTDGGLTMAALSLPIDGFASFKKEPLKNMMTHLESLPLLAPRLRQAELASELYGSGNIPSYQRIPYGPGWALVGDAHQILDPWSGMGIDHAATHADMLADALHRWLNEEASWKTSMHEYHMSIRGWSKKTYRRTTTYAADFRPMTQTALEKRGLSLVKTFSF